MALVMLVHRQSVTQSPGQVAAQNLIVARLPDRQDSQNPVSLAGSLLAFALLLVCLAAIGDSGPPTEAGVATGQDWPDSQAAGGPTDPATAPLPGYRPIYVPPPTQAGTQTAGFQISWSAAGCPAPPAGATAALDYAAGIWAALISSPVPIRVSACWSSTLPGNALATGWPVAYARNFPGAAMADTFYGIALANAIAGQDLSPVAYHISIAFNATAAWSFATGSAPPVGQYDFVSAALHELGHGLGFVGWMYESYNVGFCGTGPYAHLKPWCPTPYDRLATDSGGTPLLSYLTPDPRVLGGKLKSDARFNGPNARARNGDSSVKLYTPAQWADASYLHLDDSVAGGQTIMKRGLAQGERIHNLSQPERGLFHDLGWVPAGSDPYLNSGGPLALRVGRSASFSATLVWPAYAGQTMTYAWSATEQAPVNHTSRGQSDTASFGWQTPGVKLVMVRATGATAPAGATRAVLVFNVALSGPATGSVGASYTFNAALAPEDRLIPDVTYRWQATGQADVAHPGLAATDSATFSWGTGGAKTITVTATIAGEAAAATHTISLPGLDRFVYLPVVVKR
jgi:hypothetical protein